MANDPGRKIPPSSFEARNEEFHKDLEVLMNKHGIGLTTSFQVIGGEVQPETIQITVIDKLGKPG